MDSINMDKRDSPIQAAEFGTLPSWKLNDDIQR
jgi:hypothetical protein